MRHAFAVLIRPHDALAEAVRLSNDGIFRHNYPLMMQPNPITSIVCIPIDIFDADAISKRTAETFPTRQLIKPCVQRVAGIAAIIPRQRNPIEEPKADRRNDDRGGDCERKFQPINIPGAFEIAPRIVVGRL